MEFRGLTINTRDGRIHISIFPAGIGGFIAMAKDEQRGITVHEYADGRIQAMRMALHLLKKSNPEK